MPSPASISKKQQRKQDERRQKDDASTESSSCCEGNSEHTPGTSPASPIPSPRLLVEEEDDTATSKSSLLLSPQRPILKKRDPSRSKLLIRNNSSARFCLENIEIVEVPKHPVKEFSTFFYDDEEIAQFRHDAWVEECGFNPEDFQ